MALLSMSLTPHRSLELMRCGNVTGQGIATVALSCANLTNFKLHNCPEVWLKNTTPAYSECITCFALYAASNACVMHAHSLDIYPAKSFACGPLHTYAPGPAIIVFLTLVCFAWCNGPSHGPFACAVRTLVICLTD